MRLLRDYKWFFKSFGLQAECCYKKCVEHGIGGARAREFTEIRRGGNPQPGELPEATEERGEKINPPEELTWA